MHEFTRVLSEPNWSDRKGKKKKNKKKMCASGYQNENRDSR